MSNELTHEDLLSLSQPSVSVPDDTPLQGLRAKYRNIPLPRPDVLQHFRDMRDGRHLTDDQLFTVILTVFGGPRGAIEVGSSRFSVANYIEDRDPLLSGEDNGEDLSRFRQLMGEALSLLSSNAIGRRYPKASALREAAVAGELPAWDGSYTYFYRLDAVVAEVLARRVCAYTHPAAASEAYRSAVLRLGGDDHSSRLDEAVAYYMAVAPGLLEELADEDMEA